jgi:hypothetical protein
VINIFNIICAFSLNKRSEWELLWLDDMNISMNRSVVLYEEKLRTVMEVLRPVKKSHLNHNTLLGCGGKDKKRHV